MQANVKAPLEIIMMLMINKIIQVESTSTKTTLKTKATAFWIAWSKHLSTETEHRKHLSLEVLSYTNPGSISIFNMLVKKKCFQSKLKGTPTHNKHVQ